MGLFWLPRIKAADRDHLGCTTPLNEDNVQVSNSIYLTIVKNWSRMLGICLHQGPLIANILAACYIFVPRHNLEINIKVILQV